MIYIIFAIIAAYVLGSVPTGYIFGRIVKNVDIREHGSGNVGATNVFRTVGKIPGITVLVLDFMKGLLAVTVIPLCLRKISPSGIEFYVYILLGSAAIAGHIWTVFLGFKGGKGVATTAGVMTGLSPGIFLACFVIWMIVFAIWRYVSLASIVAAVSLPLFAVLFNKHISFILFCSAFCLVGVHSHRSNIQRLIQGIEKKM